MVLLSQLGSCSTQAIDSDIALPTSLIFVLTHKDKRVEHGRWDMFCGKHLKSGGRKEEQTLSLVRPGGVRGMAAQPLVSHLLPHKEAHLCPLQAWYTSPSSIVVLS